MGFLDTIDSAKLYLEKQGRVSLRVLQLEFDLDEARLEALAAELVDIQSIATREGDVLVHVGSAQADSPRAESVPQVSGPLSHTPKHLADKILQSKSALEGERKQVTVLFADVKGSMDLAEQLDAEEWSAIMGRFFTILSEGVERFEGFVDKFTGDGIMALFGAPIAHEDHAQRACYAALHLRERLRAYADELRITRGVNFSFRMGLNSGDVVVGSIGTTGTSGNDIRMDYTAQGHTVGLAQRMEQLAPADSTALSEHTQRFVDGFFALRSLGPTQIKGAREPVGVFVLEGLGEHRTRLDISRTRGLSRFVGRSDEMEGLEAALAHSLQGAGRVAAAVGEAGVGKSRLCSEFVERCRARGLVVYEAHCPAHGKTIPYLPLLELLRNLFGITEQDNPREARQKIAGELALLDDGFADDRALVLDFLGVSDPSAPSLQLEPAVRQRRLFTFLRRLIQLRTQAEPIVLLIDDLHWIDPGSDLFVAQIVEAVSTTRTLLLVNFRPEYSADWMRKSWVLQLPMAPLGTQALTELVRDWVGSSPSVASLAELVGARSGGNPFFAEEIVLSLIDTGRLAGTRGAYELTESLDAIDVPATVQSLLAARIDRLGEDEKQVIYTAAVIGKEFARPLLESIAELGADDLDAALAGLLAAEMVYERAIYPVLEYAFKHPLTHEVALGAQLNVARQRRHAAVADAIESTEAERLDEHAGLLAHHWAEAGESLRAAGWHERAACWVRPSDMAAARRHWTQSRELLVTLADCDEKTRLLLDVYPALIDTLDRLGADPAESEAVYLEAIDVAQGAGDRNIEGLVEAAYAYLKTAQNDWLAVIKHAERAVALADAESNRPVQVFARFSLGRALNWKGRFHEGQAVFDRGVEIGGGDDAVDLEVLGWRPYLECLSVRSTGHSFLGRPREALEFVDRLPALIRRSETPADISSPLCDCVWTCWIRGDAERAKRYAGEALHMAERFGADRNVVYALLVSGVARGLAQRWKEGEAFLDRARARIAAAGAGGEWTNLINGMSALYHAEMGNHERALALSLGAVEKAHADDLDIQVCVQGTWRCRVLRTVGGTAEQDALEAQITETMAALERTGMKGYMPMLLLERAGLAQLRGDNAGMKQDMTEARRLFAEMDVTGWDDYARSIEA